MKRQHFVKYLMEKAESFFLQSKDQEEKAKYAERSGDQLGAAAVTHGNLSKSELLQSDKSEELAKTFDANARIQHDRARSNRNKSDASEKVAVDLTSKSDTEYQKARIFRENAADLKSSGEQLETKAVEIESELQRDKWSNNN